jgi:hypothetical protein
VKIAHQPGQPDEPHTEIISSFKNVGKDAPRKSELIGEAKSELLELPPVPAVPLNPALSAVKVEDFFFFTFRLTYTADRM